MSPWSRTAPCRSCTSNARSGADVVGNIYQGKVARVLPGMQSAFVDIGLERAAFLHVADLHAGFAPQGMAATAAAATRRRRSSAWCSRARR